MYEVTVDPNDFQEPKSPSLKARRGPYGTFHRKNDYSGFKAKKNRQMNLISFITKTTSNQFRRFVNSVETVEATSLDNDVRN